MEAEIPRCPSCGAPIEGAVRADEGIVCQYCGNEVLVGPDGKALVKPAGETIGGALLSPVSQAWLRVVLALALGWWGVFLALMVWRRGWGLVEPPAAIVITGVVTLVWALLLKRRLGAGALAAVVGLAFLLKPWVFPLVGHSPTSETAFYYSVSGGVLLALALLMILTLRKGRLKDELSLLRPRPVVALALVFGLAGGIAVHSGETGIQVVARYQAEYDARREQLARFAKQIESSPPGTFPKQALELGPPPSFRDGKPETSNTEIVPLLHLTRPLRSVDLNLYYSGDLADGVRTTHPEYRLGDRYGWLAADFWERDLKKGLEVRYLGVYKGEKEGYELEVWLIDLERDSVVLHVTHSGTRLEWDKAGPLVLELLGKATGGQFED